VTTDPPVNGPEIVLLPSQRMAALYVKGRPDQVLPGAIVALRKSLYALKFLHAREGGPDFTMDRVRVRFPDAHLLPVMQWTTVVGVPVPDTTQALPRLVGGEPVRLELWEYGPVAQIGCGSTDADLGRLAETLHRFIADSGHVVVGVHEEEYLAGDDGALTAAVIRYRVRPA
jgi:hypothetical protein